MYVEGVSGTTPPTEVGPRGGDESLRIEKIGKTSILKFAQTAYRLSKQTMPEYSSKFSKKTFTLRQHAVIICLKIREDKNYREIVEMLVEMPRIRRAIELDEIPHFTTLCKAFDRLQSKLWRSLLKDTSELLELNGIVTIDSSGRNSLSLMPPVWGTTKQKSYLNPNFQNTLIKKKIFHV